MWTYTQRSGRMRDASGVVHGTGYAGAGRFGKNNPDTEIVPNVGPLPVGQYTINPPVDTMTHGPYVLWLTPSPTNEMFGRSAFGIHGDSVVNPGSASEGCIVMARAVRMAIWESGDHELEVRAEEPVLA